MKHILRIVMLVLVASVLLLCTGCSQMLGAMEDKELRGYTETMLDAIIEDEYDVGYALVDDVCTSEEFSSMFTAARKLFGDADAYELTPIGFYRNRSVNNGETVDSVQTVYVMTVNSQNYVVDVTTHSTYEHLSSFHISPYENTNYYRTGELGAMKSANALQWVMLLSNIISIALIAFALVDSCRRNIKRKPLWIALIALGLVTVGVTFATNRFNFNLAINWLFKYSALILYGGGTTVFQVMLPVGAIAYFVLRHKLVIKSAPEVTEEQTTAEPIAEEQASSPSESDQESNENGTDAE